MSTKPKQPTAYLRLTIMIPRPKEPFLFHSDSIPLTPERMDLLLQLVGPDKWKRSRLARKVTWADLQAAVARYLDKSQ